MATRARTGKIDQNKKRFHVDRHGRPVPLCTGHVCRGKCESATIRRAGTIQINIRWGAQRMACTKFFPWLPTGTSPAAFMCVTVSLFNLFVSPCQKQCGPSVEADTTSFL